MSYNIRLDIPSDGINRWSERREQFIGQVRLMRPAILGLQEVVPGQKADLEAALPGYQFLGVARDDGRAKGEFSNLAIDRDEFQRPVERDFLAVADAGRTVEGLGRGLSPNRDVGEAGPPIRRPPLPRGEHAYGSRRPDSPA